MFRTKLVLIVLAHLAVAGGVWWTCDSEDPYARAHRMVAHGDLREALKELQATVKARPQSIEAHYRLGQLLLQLGEAVAAEKQLHYALDNGWNPEQAIPRLAQAYMAQGRHRDMLRDFQPAAMAPRLKGTILSMRALAQIAVGDVEAAQSSALEAERLLPEALDPKLALAHVALAKNDAEWAEAKAGQALAINPAAPEALLMKGQLLTRRGAREAALDVLDDAIRLNPNILLVRLERANSLIGLGRDEAAREDVDFVLKAEPLSVLGNYLETVLQARAGDFLLADLALGRIHRQLDQFPLGWFYFAVVKYNIGQGEQAAIAARRHLAANPDDPQAIKLFAQVELAGRRPAAVVECLSAAARQGLADGEMFDLLGRAQLLAGAPMPAIDSFQRAAALTRDNADIVRRLESVRVSTVDAGGAGTYSVSALAASRK